ncbi:MAG: hypothetical protein P8R54_16635 [Myxococcota bacterium]|nr:hypothetical protein [Myxococcota bacterium]
MLEELCTTEARRQESLAMRHCVRLHDWKCCRGRAVTSRLSSDQPALTIAL